MENQNGPPLLVEEVISKELKKITDKVPKIYGKDLSSTFVVLFEKVVMTEEELNKIYTSLKQFGTVTNNNFKSSNFVSFIIRR